jgi:hypothetical protein
VSAKREIDARAREPAVGFHAELEGASLWDLVQMECLARARSAFEVTGEGGVGYLYFDAGRVVHALTTRARGPAAAFEILGWTHGTFQPTARAWPSGPPTIDLPHESLLLQVAKRRDEALASNLVACPTRGVDVAVEAALDDFELVEVEDDGGGEGLGERGGTKDMRNATIDQTPDAPALARAENAADFNIMLRLAASGAVLRNKGGSEELAEATAYAHRLVQLTGELLGFDELVAFECVFVGNRFIVFAEGDGDVVALRPRPDLNLQPLRERLGL